MIDTLFHKFSLQECPGRFYCEDYGKNWVSPDQVCDNTKHCESGQDECAGCYHGGISSSELLIKSYPIAGATVIGGIFILATNIMVGYQTWMSEVSTKSGDIDKLLRLQVCFYDFLMGVYLSLIVVAAGVIRASGRYCLQDQYWRSSIYCNCLGVIFSFSSHGSLLVVSLISIIRCIKCSLSFIEIPVRLIVCLSIIILMVNTAHALLPIIPVSSITNFFRSGIYLDYFKNNPFFNQVGNLNITHLKEIHRTMFNLTSEAENKMNDIHQIVRELENITSDSNAFSITDIGYYGNSPLCMGNIFKVEAEGTFLFYKIVYFMLIGILLIVVIISYKIIIIANNRSQAGVRDEPAQGPSPLTVKLSLMIISQLAAWCSFIATACYFTWWAGDSPPSLVFEIFTLLVIPGNSFLNPVFYSTFYKNIKRKLWQFWRNKILPRAIPE